MITLVPISIHIGNSEDSAISTLNMLQGPVGKPTVDFSQLSVFQYQHQFRVCIVCLMVLALLTRVIGGK